MFRRAMKHVTTVLHGRKGRNKTNKTYTVKAFIGIASAG